MPGSAGIAENRQTRHEYWLQERFSAGLVLDGWEVKSLRAGKVQLTGSYVIVKNNQAWLLNAILVPLESTDSHGHLDPKRDRKLLLHKSELHKISRATEQKGMTCVCVRLFWKGPWAKAEIALARGKKLHDKRAVERDRRLQREHRRVVATARR